jgi:hypothetical protein
MKRGFIILTDLAAPEGEGKAHWRLPQVERFIHRAKRVERGVEFETALARSLNGNQDTPVHWASLGQDLPSTLYASETAKAQCGQYFVSLLQLNIGLSSIAVDGLVAVNEPDIAPLQATLAAHFASNGFEWSVFGRDWHLRTPTQWDWQTPKATQLVGRDLRHIPIGGTDARQLKQLLTEAQMLLFPFKPNASQAYGLWLWGHGVAPIPAYPRPVSLHGSDELLRQWLTPAHQDPQQALPSDTDPMVDVLSVEPTVLTPHAAGEDWAKRLDARVAERLAWLASVGCEQVWLHLDGNAFVAPPKRFAITNFWRQFTRPQAWWELI